MNRRSYYSHTYFSIPDILASKERVPCTTNVCFPKMGFLFPENDDEDVKEGTAINIPIWLAKGLSSRQMRYVTVDVPNCFKEKTREVLEADPRIVNLYRLNPYFFIFGALYVNLNQKESEIIRELLKRVYIERIRKLLSWSIHRMSDPLQIQELDLTEQEFLRTGQKSNEMLNEWLTKSEMKLKPAESVVNLKKRKLLEDGYGSICPPNKKVLLISTLGDF